VKGMGQRTIERKSECSGESWAQVGPTANYSNRGRKDPDEGLGREAPELRAAIAWRRSHRPGGPTILGNAGEAAESGRENDLLPRRGRWASTGKCRPGPGHRLSTVWAATKESPSEERVETAGGRQHIHPTRMDV
jgi:hypothetical protein